MKTHKLSVLLILLLACLGFSSCIGTVRPKPVINKNISWDGTNQNSGFLGFTNNMGIITSNAYERLNFMIGRYSNKFAPPLKTNDGIIFTNNMVLIDKERLEKFIKMSQYYRNGQ